MSNPETWLRMKQKWHSLKRKASAFLEEEKEVSALALVVLKEYPDEAIDYFCTSHRFNDEYARETAK